MNVANGVVMGAVAAAVGVEIIVGVKNGGGGAILLGWGSLGFFE